MFNGVKPIKCTFRSRCTFRANRLEETYKKEVTGASDGASCEEVSGAGQEGAEKQADGSFGQSEDRPDAIFAVVLPIRERGRRQDHARRFAGSSAAPI